MGKSDIVHLKPGRIEMSEKDHPKLFTIGPSQKDPDDCEMIKNETNFPPGMELLTNQVAGHMNNGKTLEKNNEKFYTGMLREDGAVLKPITKPFNGQIEIDFYEELTTTYEDALLELKEFVPKYYGTKTITVNDKEIKCIVLEDLTKNFQEPCIMDIKIGKRTWDPLASYEKIISEDKKYQDTKRELGICIPGFLIHKISNGRVCRYGKEFGKKLNTETIKEALKTFLNADSGLSRELLLQLLVDLWRILHWARRQRKIRLFSSSLLLIYDARRLKQYISNNNVGLSKSSSYTPCTNTNRSAHLYKPLSLMKLNDDCPCTGFSGQFTKEGPILKSTPSTKLARFATTTNTNSDHPWRKHISKLRRVHSFQNDYDKDLQKMRKDYTNMLDDLVNDQRNEVWTSVKMIDFAHVFPAEHAEVDKNYLEGIENLIKILEGFLSETVNT